MLKPLKQSLDRFAIKLAAKSLPAPRPDPLQRAEAERLMQNPAFLVPPDEIPKVAVQADGCFTFRSLVSSASERNNLARGRLFRCGADWQNKPAVLLVHGWNAELHYLYGCPRIAKALNLEGLNAILLELPYHLSRRPDRSGMCDFICDNIPGMLLATRQAVADIHAILRWARAEGCPSTAAWGFSLGGWLVGLHLCFTSALDAAVLTTPILNLRRAVAELEFCHPIRAALAVAPVELGPLNLPSMKPSIPAESIRVEEGKYDLFIPHGTYEDLAAAWGIRDWHCAPQSHISILFSRRSARQSIEWLKTHLSPR